MASQKKNLWNNSYVQAFVVVVLAAGVVLFFLFGSQLALNTNITPALAVVSGSMCIPYDGAYDGWSQPFTRTLHVGDIIIIQGVSPDSLKTAYPNSDIIVFHQPNNPDELIVHRIVNNITLDGKLYFFTKGDGNSAPDTWPTVPTTGEYDPWQSSNSTIPDGAVSEDLIVGKVVMRIPWIGNAAIFMHDTFGVSNSQMFVPVILILIILLVIVEFGWSLLKKKP